tara:strand:- start:1603 stop:2220 length:618 start_codon:yes stop_codon:yes gene_type:complete
MEPKPTKYGIEGDSVEYELLEKVCSLINTEKPFTCEVGVRLGKGSYTILKSLKHKNHWHIGIDPYGDIDYEHFDKNSGIKHKSGKSPTYPNSMKTTLLQNIGFDNFTLFHMSDTDFMNKFSEGVPIYRKQREVINNYDLVFLDGPHKTFDVLKELVFFGERLTNQGFIIFDDYTTYNFDLLIKVAELINIKPMHIMENKIVMRKY